MMDSDERLAGVNRRLDIIFANKKSIEDKLSGNHISPFKRQCLEYQLGCLEKSSSRLTAQLMGATT
ncbi:MAG: hypothetical protein Q8P08_02460 [bacterium]|nr:hypothetical protein [bacterium]